MAIGGAVAGVLAKKEYDDAKTTPPSPADLPGKQSSVNTKAWIADGLYIAAAAVAATGLVLVLTAPSASASSPPTHASVGLAPVAGGGAVVLSGGF